MEISSRLACVLRTSSSLCIFVMLNCVCSGIGVSVPNGELTLIRYQSACSFASLLESVRDAVCSLLSAPLNDLRSCWLVIASLLLVTYPLLTTFLRHYCFKILVSYDAILVVKDPLCSQSRLVVHWDPYGNGKHMFIVTVELWTCCLSW